MTRNIRVRGTKSRKFYLLLVGACVLSFVAALGAEHYVLAYMPFGGGWSSRILVTNPSDEIVNVELLFFSGKETAHRPSKLDSLDGKRIVLQPGATRSVDLALSKLDTKNIGWAVAKTDAPINIFSTFDFSIPQNLPNLASEIPELAAVNSQASEPNCALCLSANSTPAIDQIGPPPAPPGGPV